MRFAPPGRRPLGPAPSATPSPASAVTVASTCLAPPGGSDPGAPAPAIAEGPLFRGLTHYLSEHLEAQVEALIRACPPAPPPALLADLYVLVQGPGAAHEQLSRADRDRLTQYVLARDPQELTDRIAGLQERLGKTAWRRLPPATTTQLKIITDTMVEVGLDFTAILPSLTSWQADCLIKGLIVLHQTRRETGQPYLQAPCVRLALRDHFGKCRKDEEFYRHERPSALEREEGTAALLQRILSAQAEVGLDFTALLPELDQDQAEVVLRGIVAVSEVQRQTGDRHFPIRDLRHALRAFFRKARVIR